MDATGSHLCSPMTTCLMSPASPRSYPSATLKLKTKPVAETYGTVVPASSSLRILPRHTMAVRGYTHALHPYRIRRSWAPAPKWLARWTSAATRRFQSRMWGRRCAVLWRDVNETSRNSRHSLTGPLSALKRRRYISDLPYSSLPEQRDCSRGRFRLHRDVLQPDSPAWVRRRPLTFGV